jgi:hypothetical protein
VTRPPAATDHTFAERFAVATFADGGVVVDLERGALFGVDARAARVCELLVEFADSRRVAQALADAGMAPREAAASAVAAVLGALESAPPPDLAGLPFSLKVDGPEYHLVFAGTSLLAFDSQGRQARLLSPPPGGSGFGVEDCLRFASPRILYLRGHVVMHASACRYAGRVVAFCGPSGAGKTTTARAFAAAGASMLSEDLLPLSISSESVAAFGEGETRILAWARTAAQRLRSRPDAVVDCAELDSAAEGATERLSELRFLARERTTGGDFVVRALPSGQALRYVLQSCLLGSQRPADWKVFLDRCRLVASLVPTSIASAPEGIDALASAARQIASSAS